MDNTNGSADYASKRLRRAAGIAVLDRLPYALIIVDERARVVMMNAAARQAIADGRGLHLENDVLRATRESDDRQLTAAITAAADATASCLSTTGALRLATCADEMPVLVLPANINVDPLLGRRGLAFIVFGGEAHTPHRELLVAMYGFTAREAELACALIGGSDLADAARTLGMTIHTARTHLRRLMDKTETTRQGDLVRVLLGSMPPRA